MKNHIHNKPANPVNVGNKKVAVLFADSNSLVAFFDMGGSIAERSVKQLSARQSLSEVFRDAGFTNDSVKINVEQIFKLVSPSPKLKTI